jgi:hypothetical protein
MNPVRSRKNQYLGINAHLHSFWQAEHKWNRFHNAHITDLVKLLKAQLLPMGYTAEIEESLQIRRIGDDLPRRPRPDIIVRDLDSARTVQPTVIPDVQVLELDDLMEAEPDVEHPYYAVVIYEQPEEAVAWIELLSPTNKGDHKDAYTYLAKRQLALESGKVFVEIDYLHETTPTFDRLPDYSRGEGGAYPYRIVVIDPRPEYREARVYLKEFLVDSSIPAMTIPLNGGDQLDFDFGAAYQKTFEEMLYGLEDVVDYRQLPLNFDLYSPADQSRILARMLSVLKAARDNANLEDVPFMVEAISVEDGLAKLAVLNT